MLKKYFIGLILLSFSVCNTSWAQDPKEQAEQFLSTLIEGKIDSAYDTIFAGTAFVELKPQAIQAMKAQTNTAFSLYGQPIAFEIIHDEILSLSLRRMVYLLKFDQYPVTWEMYFYNGKSNWKIAQITFVDQFQNISSKK